MSVNSSISPCRLTRGSYTSYFTLQISNNFHATVRTQSAGELVLEELAQVYKTQYSDKTTASVLNFKSAHRGTPSAGV